MLNRELITLLRIKLRDPYHYTALYRGVAHNDCNLKYLTLDHIPIVFHNLCGYDAHIFIKGLRKKYKNYNIGVTGDIY